MTHARYTVGALLAFVEQMRTAPGYTQKAVSDIRSGTRMVLRHLNLEPDNTWDLEIVSDWAHAYTDTPHAESVSPVTVRSYQDRLRTAARLFHRFHTEAPAAAASPVILVPGQIQPSAATLRDLQLLAAAWRTTPSEAITRLVDFYRRTATT